MDGSFDSPQNKFIPWIIVGFGILVFVVVLIALFEPLNGPRNVAFRSTALHDEKLIVAAVKAYQTEYHTLPVDPNASGVIVFSRDNNLLFDALRNRTGTMVGNSLNPRGLAILRVPDARDQKNPKSGIQVSTGIWYDPWGSPYHVAMDVSLDGSLNEKNRIPGFYTDVGPLKNLEVIVWSYGENGKLGGGPASKFGFSDEKGSPGRLFGSGDVVSWK